MYKNFDEMVAAVKTGRRGTVVIAAAQTESVLDAAILAKQDELADCLLVGDKPEIQALLQKMAPELANGFEIVDVGADLNQAAKRSVELVREGKGAQTRYRLG